MDDTAKLAGSKSSNSNDRDEIAHDAVTLALAKRESAHHYHGMPELFSSMRQRSLLISAYPLSEDITDSCDESDLQQKIIHFLRHGQGFHNLLADIYSSEGKTWTQFKNEADNPYVKVEITDAPLTQKGRQQARSLQPTIESLQHQPELVVLSSNCRAIQTGLIAYESLLDKGIPFIAHEMIREETGVHVCDKRRSKLEQEREFPQVDFSLLEDEEDTIYRDYARESKAEVGDRIYQFMNWLSNRPEKHIAVVSHSGLLMTLFNGVVQSEHESLKEWFQTGELRSAKLVFSTNEE